MRYVAVCDGVLSAVGSQIECAGTWLTSIDASPIPGAFDIGVLNTSLVAEYFGAGFGIVGMCAVLGIGVGLILNAIRSL